LRGFRHRAGKARPCLRLAVDNPMLCGEKRRVYAVFCRLWEPRGHVGMMPRRVLRNALDAHFSTPLPLSGH
jgi:hypothetical protein